GTGFFFSRTVSSLEKKKKPCDCFRCTCLGCVAERGGFFFSHDPHFVNQEQSRGIFALFFACLLAKFVDGRLSVRTRWLVHGCKPLFGSQWLARAPLCTFACLFQDGQPQDG